MTTQPATDFYHRLFCLVSFSHSNTNQDTFILNRVWFYCKTLSLVIAWLSVKCDIPLGLNEKEYLYLKVLANEKNQLQWRKEVISWYIIPPVQFESYWIFSLNSLVLYSIWIQNEAVKNAASSLQSTLMSN